MSCPFIEAGNSECSEILNMQHLDEAFGRCTGDYEGCPVFAELIVQEVLHPVGVAGEWAEGKGC